MKKIKEYRYVIYAFLILALVFYLDNLNSAVEVDIENSVDLTYDILQEPPLDINHTIDGYGLYIPTSFSVNYVDNGVILENDEVKYSLYFGVDTSKNTEILANMNPDLPSIYQMYPNTFNYNTYIGVWEYTPIETTDYIEVVIVNNDSFIAGVMPKSESEKYMTEMAYIFNSIKKIN